MKKIFGFIFAAAALVFVIPFAMADGENATIQKGPDYETNATEEHEASIGYKKSISSPNTDGVYTITLESFALGESIKMQKSVPADIVLVLDVSGSMSNRIGGSGTPTRISALRTAVNTFIDSVEENDRVDPITGKTRTRRLGNRIAVVAFSGPANFGDEATLANSIKVNTGWITMGNNLDIEDFTGYNNLKDNIITADGLPVGGATFADLGMQTAYNLVHALGDDRTLRTVVLFTDGVPGYGTNFSNYAWANTTRVLTQSGSNYSRTTWESANAAINYAKLIKDEATDKINSKVYTISIINNPDSYTNVYLDQVSSNYLDAERMAELGNFRYGNTTYKRIINPEWSFSQSAEWTSRSGHKTSSDYAYATTDADKLKSIFKTIADDSGGGSEDLGEQTMSQVDVVSTSFKMPDGANKDNIKVFIAECYDKVTNKQYLDDDGNVQTGDFLIFHEAVQTWPEGNPNKDGRPVELSGYTYQQKTVDPETGSEVITTVPVDRNIRVVLEPSDPNQPDRLDVIKVNGFDYGGNWCGPRYDEDGTTLLGYHGYKVLIEIPIMMNPTAVGGPDVATNAEGSGIHVKGENIAPFKSPKVSLPVNLHIRKDGLKDGESAKFTIERKLTTETDDDWKEVTSVFVTRREGQAESGPNAPVTKVIGLPSVDENDREYVYRIVEDDWNWSYTLSKIQDANGVTLGNLATRSALSTDLITNPFVFVNTKITGINQKVRHAESKATNIFKTGIEENPTYDDSKDNGR